LIADLSSDRAAVRDGAVARLMVIGTRAVARLAAAAQDSGARTDARIAALRALEGIGDARGFVAAATAIDDPDIDVAAAAVRATAGALGTPHEAPAVDRLAAVALDVSRPAAVREEAVHALEGLRATAAPLFDVLARDPAPSLRQAAARVHRGDEIDSEEAPATIAATLRSAPLADPEALRKAVLRAGKSAALPDLRQIVDAAREREASAPSAERQHWLQVRAAAHAVLARRGSRLAVFDLRETVESATIALPVEFIGALAAVGDASCLAGIAAAWERANRGRRDAWWQRHLADAFRTIVARERLTRRHAVLKRIGKRWPAASAALLGPARQ
jgi:hypothetical protein